MTRIITILTSVVALAMLAGCGLFLDATQDVDPTDQGEGLTTLEVDETLDVLASDTDEADFKAAFMKTFELESSGGVAARGVRPVIGPAARGIASKATVPVDSGGFTFTSGSLADYPEEGLTTAYTVESADADEAVYLITSTTTYPAGSEMSSYVEEYYVQDVVPVGTWNEDDPIVAPDGDTWKEDRTHRTKMEIAFADGSVRYETIVKMIWVEVDDVPGFAAFEILRDAEDVMEFPEFAYPEKDETAIYSSIVTYTHLRNQVHDFWFWEGVEKQDIAGIRYYTEHYVNGNTQYKGTMAAYEKALSNLETHGGDLVPQLQGIFVGNINTVLAESVIRKEVLFNVTGGSVDPAAVGQNTVMRSHVVNVKDDTDFQVQLTNEDVPRLLEWGGETSHIPSGDEGEIESIDNDGDNEDEGDDNGRRVRTRTRNRDGKEMPLSKDTDEAVEDDFEDIVALYEAIRSGSAVDIVGDFDITGTIDPEGQILEFDGGQGTTYADDDAHDLTTSGTVEAWVYIDKHTNWGGIVHKGIRKDFKDEAYSLQFWGNKGNVSFAIVEQSPRYKYSVATSTKRLNKNKWYYLVGTWDADTVKVYVNGELAKSVANKLTAKVPFVSDAPLVLGSQLADSEAQVLRGYYGTDGKVNGVKVTAGAKTVAEILQFYNDNVSKTTNW